MERGRAGWRIEGIRRSKVERRDLLTTQRQLETGNWWRHRTSQMRVLFLQLSLGSGAGVQDCSRQAVDPAQRKCRTRSMPSGDGRDKVEGQVGARSQ